MNPSDSNELSREELYERIWSTPEAQLAAELGISEVDLVKRCKKLRVPRPRARHRVKIAAGKMPRKIPLPPTPQEAFIKAAEARIAKALPLPETIDDLHPLALELRRKLNAGKPDSQKRVDVREVTLPKVEISKPLIERAVKSFHTILSGVEPLGITFRKSMGSWGPGYFRRGNDRLFLTIKEPLKDQTGALLPELGWYPNQGTPAGTLTFLLNPSDYGIKEEKQWKEGNKFPLGRVLSESVTAIRQHFVEAQKRRVQEAIESKRREIEWERHRKEQQAKEAIREEQERKDRHAKALEATARCRAQDLLKAVEWWRLFQNAAAFIDHCEQRWRDSQANGLTSEQQAWLKWARENAEVLSPFQTGYPDPLEDGAFESSAVPFGGPYPRKREFPPPPTMSKVLRQIGSSEQPSEAADDD